MGVTVGAETDRRILRRWVLWTPLLLFGIFFALVATGLFAPADRTVKSRLIGEPLPALTLPAIVPNHAGFATTGSGPRLVNIFASWCPPCASEVEQLELLKRRGVIIDGIAVRDTRQDLAKFLTDYGDPYRAIGSDPRSASMIALGSSGVPETFIVDARGIIRYQHIGPVGTQDLEDIARAYEAAR